MEEDETLTMREVSQRLGVPSREVRYLCSRGLVPNVRRKRSGYRIFTPQQCDWIETLIYLRHSGFTDKELRKYRDFCRKGPETVLERKSMITTKKRQMRQKMEEINRIVDFLERREELFDAINTGRSPESSHWL